jgi:multisubunit Na+/H+ antiporter MnhF subunit
VTVWVLTAGAMTALIGLASIAAVRRTTLDRLVGLQLVGVIAPLLLIVVAIATAQPVLLEVGLALVLLSFAGGLAFARFLERWL